MINERILQAFRQAIQERRQHPFGLLLYFGPDDRTVTKIIAGVMPAPGTHPEARSWQGDQVTEDPAVIQAIGEFFKSHRVHDVVMTEGVAGCPHEPGIDYPDGESCPYCPYWAQKANIRE